MCRFKFLPSPLISVPCSAYLLSRVQLFVTSSPWDSPDKNTGVGCHALLQGILLTQGSNPLLLRLLHWQAFSLLESSGKPLSSSKIYQKWAQILPEGHSLPISNSKAYYSQGILMILVQSSQAKGMRCPYSGILGMSNYQENKEISLSKNIVNMQDTNKKHGLTWSLLILLSKSSIE